MIDKNSLYFACRTCQRADLTQEKFPICTATSCGVTEAFKERVHSELEDACYKCGENGDIFPVGERHLFVCDEHRPSLIRYLST